MALAITWEKKLTIAWGFFDSGSVGVITPREGRLLAGLHDASDFPTFQKFYASENNGVDWLEISSLEDYGTTYSSRLAHWPDGIICYATSDRNQKDLFVYRSTDYGQTWSLVHTFESPDAFANGPFTCGATTYNRDSAAFLGRPIQPHLGPESSQIIYTTDKGATWTDGGMITTPGANNKVWSIQARSHQNFLIGASPSIIYKSHPLLTASATGTLPTPGGNSIADILAVAWLSETDCVAGGYGQGGGDEHYPYLYWSDDSGTTWNAVSRSDIAGWPNSGGTHPAIRNLHRLTKDAVAASFYLTPGNAPPPILVSKDKGHTYQDISSSSGGWPPTNVSAQGRLGSASNGDLIATLEISDPGDTRVELWLGHVTC